MSSTTSTHRDALRERLAELRTKLKAALADRKARMTELRALARKERLALRQELRAMREQALGELAAKMRNARAAAKLARVARRAQAKAMHDSVIAEARAALQIEREHQAEMRRVDTEERRRRGVIESDHAKRVSDGVVRAAVIGHFGPLFERYATTVVPTAGESKTEAVLRHAERRPDEAHAILEPAKERAIAKVRADVETAEEALRRLPKAAPANRTKRPTSSPTPSPVASAAPPAAGSGFDDALGRFVENEQRALNTPGQRLALGTGPFVLQVQPGPRYARVVRLERAGAGARSVYAFVDSTNGDVLNPASWTKPKPARMGTRLRGNVYTASAPAASPPVKPKAPTKKRGRSGRQPGASPR